jgi:hypothetical protein
MSAPIFLARSGVNCACPGHVVRGLGSWFWRGRRRTLAPNADRDSPFEAALPPQNTVSVPLFAAPAGTTGVRWPMPRLL